MKLNHDLHIHSQLSLCSNDPGQTTENILAYAVRNGLKEICLTDHFWDDTVKMPEPFGFYEVQNLEHISRALPLPQEEGVRFLFGCETELAYDMTLGISPNTMEKMDFIIIPTTHSHFMPLNIRPEDDALHRRAQVWIDKFDAVLEMDLPFHKVGIAHLTCPLLAPAKWSDHLDTLDLISDQTLGQLFAKAEKRGVGIELNFPLERYEGDDLERMMRIYRSAKRCGCKFYFGSDAHHPADFDLVMTRFARICELLELRESDLFRIPG